jgi:hypothetical protein
MAWYKQSKKIIVQSENFKLILIIKIYTSQCKNPTLWHIPCENLKNEHIPNVT